jgi:hypothetical protein
VDLLEFVHDHAKKYGTTYDSRRRNFVKRNGEPKYKVGQHVILADRERFICVVKRVAIDWALESWIYDLDCPDVESYYTREVPEHTIEPECAISRLARLART